MTNDGKMRRGEHLTPAAEARRAAGTAGPALVWLGLFLLLPLLGVALISFLSRGAYGQIEAGFTVRNFTRLVGFGAFGFDPVYLWIIARSLVMATVTVVLCTAASFPLAFFIARLRPPWKNLALILTIIPFWTNLLIRTYAWQIILSATGWPAQWAAALGFIHPGEALFPGPFAVFVGLTCDYLPFLALPLYASVEKIDWSIAEAASDLGAGRFQVLRHALLPQIQPGLWAGVILVFIPASGQFVIPDLLGGAKTVLLGNAIQQQFGPSRDWPFGSAIACLSMGIVMLGLWLYVSTAGERAEEAIV